MGEHKPVDKREQISMRRNVFLNETYDERKKEEGDRERKERRMEKQRSLQKQIVCLLDCTLLDCLTFIVINSRATRPRYITFIQRRSHNDLNRDTILKDPRIIDERVLGLNHLGREIRNKV